MYSDDLAPFFDTTATGNASLATLAGGGVVPVIFDMAYQGGLSGFVESTGPQCTAKSADVSAAGQGSAIVIAGVTYKVTAVQPDGTGITTLMLELA